MDVLTIQEVADELNVTPGRVRQLCQENLLGRKFGRQWLITRAELDEYKNTRRPPGRPPKDYQE